mmetsp:Transcript_28513/g.39699  ORF Transcript_28513/g.39699 Transcript_28513/m.39699 type:complete len:215 (-) Transcript_28513:774-1418(-)
MDGELCSSSSTFSFLNNVALGCQAHSFELQIFACEKYITRTGLQVRRDRNDFSSVMNGINALLSACSSPSTVIYKLAQGSARSSSLPSSSQSSQSLSSSSIISFGFMRPNPKCGILSNSCAAGSILLLFNLTPVFSSSSSTFISLDTCSNSMASCILLYSVTFVGPSGSPSSNLYLFLYMSHSLTSCHGYSRLSKNQFSSSAILLKHAKHVEKL